MEENCQYGIWKNRLPFHIMPWSCVPSNFMADRRVPKFSLNICAQSPKKTFMCPKFRTNPVLMYTKCHISTNLSSFLKLCLLYCQKYLPLLQQIADSLKKFGLVDGGDTDVECLHKPS